MFKKYNFENAGGGLQDLHSWVYQRLNITLKCGCIQPSTVIFGASSILLPRLCQVLAKMERSEGSMVPRGTEKLHQQGENQKSDDPKNPINKDTLRRPYRQILQDIRSFHLRTVCALLNGDELY